MTSPADSFLSRSSVFGWIALLVCGLLLIPLVAIRFTAEVRWDMADFVVMGLLLFCAGSAFVLAARRVSPGRRWVVGLVVLGALIYVWAELAVGVFTRLGN